MKRTMLAMLCALALLAPLCAQTVGAKPDIPAGLSRAKLDNGLEVFVYEDHATPLARIQIVFRAGAAAQSADTSGAFHLLEHLALGGHRGASASAQAALLRIGAAEWGGTLGADAASYWMRLASNRVAEGLRFWAERFVKPAPIAEAALMGARAAVLEELRLRTTDPDAVFEAAVQRRLFARYPWRRDPDGAEKALLALGTEALEKLRDAYFQPANAALIVGGDVDPEATLAAIRAIFGTWESRENPWKNPLPPHPRPGVPRPTWIVYPDATVPEGLALVEARYRGPDLQSDPQASYAADLWSALVADPAGKFKKSVAKEVPKLYGRDPLSAYYVSQRDGATLSISAYFATDPALPAVERTRLFKERVRGFELTAMRGESGYYTEADYAAARARLLAARNRALETADGFVESLAFWWGSASADYFFGYPAAIARTGRAELMSFLDTYFMRNLEVVALRMNPADYERERKAFDNAGFELVTPMNAFWWQR